jgi:hypothetical protein
VARGIGGVLKSAWVMHLRVVPRDGQVAVRSPPPV